MTATSSIARVIAERFHVLSPLGCKGAMLGRDSSTGETVVLKAFAATAVPEATFAAAVRHAGLTQLHVLVDGETVWLVRPHVRGVALSERLERLPLASCRALATGLLESLAQLHAKDVAHLSVHPGNVIVNADGPIRTAALVDSAVSLLRPLRSVRFGAPEQTGLLEDSSDAGAASDLYAAGLILYEALAGQGPHDGQDNGEMLRRRLTDDPSPLREQRPQVPADVEQEIRRLIALRPKVRPASARVALDGLLGAFNSSASLVGRSTERALLAGHDRGLLLLSGPAGSGKTRLLDDLALRSDAWVLRGSGREFPRAPLLALDDVARAIAARAAREPEFAARVHPQAVAAAVMLPSLRGEFPPSGRADLGAIAALFESLTEPVLLLIDDCEWADDATLAVLHALSRGVRPAVIAAARAFAEEHPLMQIGDAAQIALGRLPDGDIEELAPGTAQLAGGNPARAAITRDCMRLAPQAAFSAEDLIAHRLDLIEPDVRRMLAWAAVLGRAFDPELLCRLADPGADRRMLAAERDGLLDGSSFRDEMLREAILDSLGAEERARLHRRAADALRGRTFERADHMLRGGERSVEAVEQARAAGAAACGRGGPEIAEHYLRAARKQVLDVAPGLALPVLEALAAVFRERGRADLAAEQLQAASRLAREPKAAARINVAIAELESPPAPARVEPTPRRRLMHTRRVQPTAPPAATPPPQAPSPEAHGAGFDDLLERGRRIAEARSARAVAAAAEDMAEALLGCKRAILLDVTGEAGAEVVGPPPRDCSEPEARVSRSLARRAASTRSACRPPLRGLERDVVASAGAADSLSVPIFVRGAVRGALYLSSCRDSHLAAHVAALAGAALESLDVLAELETLSHSLEERVEQRTAQLGETNRQLDVSLGRLTDAFERERNTAAALKHQAFHDPLTDLANRVLFINRVDHALELCARRGGELAVLFVDLDDFKTVNDSLGHSAGDELLALVAARLREVLRSADTAARLGGDEFAILIEDLAAGEGAERTAERVLKAISAPFTLGGKELIVRASIGIAMRGGGNPGVEELLRNADVAMYTAKSTGKHHYEVFEQRMHEEVMRRLELKAELERAIELGEFELHYQPIVDLRSGAISGMEALIRWRHNRRGLVPPLDFVPLAEETGLIRQMGDWVLRAACEQVHSWQQDPSNAGQHLGLGVNLSARELHEPALVESVSDALSASCLPARDLTLEITESVLMHDTDATIVRLSELRELGVKLAIDDFGTGYSSLGYLKRFPVDVLKIDKTFVDDIAIGREEAAVAAAIVTLSETLHLKTVGEGIEDTAQLAALQGLGCDFGQGYLFSRPVPHTDMGPILDGTRALTPVG